MRLSIIIHLSFLLILPFAIYGQPAKWTVMVYMNADNDLERFGVRDFLEMSKVGSTQDVNILVQMDRTPGYTEEYGNWTQTLRFKVEKNMTPTKEESLSDIGEANMGEPSVLKNFIDWGKQNYPAENYILVIWDHGDGWRYSEPDLIAAELKKLYLEDYKKDLSSIENLNERIRYNKISTWTQEIAVYKNKQKKMISDLNITTQLFASLPYEFKKKVGFASDFSDLYSSFKGFVKKSIDKIPVSQYKYLDKYSNIIDSLQLLNYSIDNLKGKIKFFGNNEIGNKSKAENNLKMGTIIADPVKAVSHDNTSKDVLYNKEIHDILADNEVSIIGFDACLMSMLETGYTLRNKANYIIGSEELEPGNGWNYTLWLTDLIVNAKMKPIELTRSIVDNYGKSYQYQNEVTLSSLDMTLIQKLCEKIHDLSNLLITNIKEEHKAIVASREDCLKYATDYTSIHSIDLSLFLYHLANNTHNTNIKDLCNQMRSIINLIVIANFHSDDRGFVSAGVSYGSFGIAIYFPKKKVYLDEAYTDANSYYPVEFVKDLSWDNFLQAYFNHIP